MPTITMMVLEVQDPDTFETVSADDRRNQSVRTGEFTVRSGRRPDVTLMRALDVDLGVFSYAASGEGDDAVEISIIDGGTLHRQTVPLLERRLADAGTAERLAAEGGDLVGVQTALSTGKWPADDAPGTEAAAFARQLLLSARAAAGDGLGVCWELRGTFSE